MLQLERRALQLGLQLRNFKDSQRLALANDVANVHIDARHVTAHLGVHIHNLVRLELSGQREHMGDIAALRRGDLGGWNGCSSRI